MEEIMLNLVSEILYLILTIAVFFTIRYIRRRTSDEEMEAVRAIVEDGVLFVQQAYRHLDGEDKYNMAVLSITSILKQKGIKIKDDELKMLIESILKRLKGEWGDLWDKESQSP